MSVHMGIIRGGTTERSRQSYLSGGVLLKHLPPRFESRDIFIDKEGIWHVGGLPVSIESALAGLDLTWNVLPAKDKELAHLAYILETHRMPQVGARMYTAHISSHHEHMKDLARSAGARAPIGYMFSLERGVDDLMDHVFRKLSGRIVVRSHDGISRHELSSFRSLPDIAGKFEENSHIHIEEAVQGTPIHVLALEGFRGEDVYVSIPAALGETGLHHTRIHEEAKQKTIGITKNLWKAIGKPHYASFYYILHPSGNVYYQRVDLEFDLTEESVFMKQLHAVGARLRDVIEHFTEWVHPHAKKGVRALR